MTRGNEHLVARNVRLPLDRPALTIRRGRLRATRNQNGETLQVLVATLIVPRRIPTAGGSSG